jgi:drug/metabolite transporter (DMT)-like permease
MTRTSASPWKVPIALAIVYLVWGSTYLAIRFAIDTMPPFLLAATRFLLAGVILLIWAGRTSEKLTSNQLKSTALIGGLMVISNATICWAELTVSSGLAALTVATVPVFMVLFAWAFGTGGRPTGLVTIGLLLGLFGVGVLVGKPSSEGETLRVGLVLLGSIGWSFASVIGKRLSLPSGLARSTAYQMICGGAIVLALGTLKGEWSEVSFSSISISSWLAFAYLVSFGSVIAFTAYVWLLANTSPAIASTYAFANPLVAVLLGGLFLGEELALSHLAAGVLILCSVLCTIIKPGRPSSDPGPETPQHLKSKDCLA